MSSVSTQINIGYDNENAIHIAASAITHLVINGVMSYFFYQYFEMNPDLAEHGDCWADPHNDDKETGSAFEIGNYNENVSEQFLKWFMFGFIICIVGIVVSLIQLVYAVTKNKMISLSAKLISCPFGCGGIAWLIAGMVLRWRHIGKVCSADYVDIDNVWPNFYMVKSGKFMHIWLILMSCLLGAMCCCICSVCSYSLVKG